MKLMHFSQWQLREVISTNQYIAGNFMPSAKPVGLWVSVEGNGDGWSDWCSQANSFDLLKEYQYSIKLSPKANILYIKNPLELDAFTQEFKAATEINQILHTAMDIDWQRVAEKYQGIIITPYLWSCRLSYYWYYGWDCASGCIWDKDAIESFEMIRPPIGVEVIDPGRNVICDMCSKDWTDDPTPGGFLLLSNGVCPDCEDRVMKGVKRYNEQWSIKAKCPPDMSHADWIRDIVRTGLYLKQQQ